MPGLTNADAIDKVYQRHLTLFGLMEFDLSPFNFFVKSRDANGNVTVGVAWTYKNNWHYAYYTVDPSGNVSPSDSNARTIDTVAKYGPFAITALESAL